MTDDRPDYSLDPYLGRFKVVRKISAAEMRERLLAGLNTDTNALKPCPFCGGEAKMLQLATDDYMARCETCWCQSPETHREQDARYAWNTRPEQQSADINAACDHHWVIPRFGEEDERVCSKCRVSAEDVTRAEDAPRQTEGLDNG